MGKFIEFLVREGGIQLESVRIAGFSLGGQTVGYVGKYLKGQLPVIIGVDPAGPLFSENSDDRLTYQDAKYVEVIHTNGLKLGYDKPLGHVDFYPNNGRTQPGCTNDLAGNCAHGRGLLYFVESITSEKGFWGTRCDSRDDITKDGCVNGDGTLRKMGGDPKENQIVNQRQVYWMRTNEEEPFAMGVQHGFWAKRCETRDDITESGCVNGDGMLRKMGGDPTFNQIVNQRQVFWLRTNDEEPFALGIAGIE
uniref:CSON006107 protein n=1 Tax=Culicoides sonorensis TaxID=179676 RepID=A0A336M0Z1_CULSO